jgi:hypothetical protein
MHCYRRMLSLRATGHEMEAWQRGESEIVSPLRGGVGRIR